MSVIVSGTIAAGAPENGSVLVTFTDTSTGVGTLTSRTLVIKDANGNTLDTINMGTTLTAMYSIGSDMYLSFTETIVDNTGTYTGTFTFISTSFYVSVFAPAVAGITNQCCDKFGVIGNLEQAELYKNAAIDMALFGQGVNAQSLITQANFLVNTPYYA